MNKHAQNKKKKQSFWYHTDLTPPEYKNDSRLQKNLTTWVSVFNWSKNNINHGYCDSNLKKFMY